MPRLFGTDGVRGVANRDLTPDLALALGRAAGEVLAPGGGLVVVGRDTRTSGPMLEGALVAGLCSSGAHAALAGVVPGPAVSFLTVRQQARAGAVISASHNPVDDNGIKFFSPDGTKIPVDVEVSIEERMETPGLKGPTGAALGSARPIDDAVAPYVEHLLGTLETPLGGLRIVLDCAFGAAWDAAPRAFRAAGADVVAMNAEPDGLRINVDCGSTSLDGVAKRVVEEDADLGVAFDGDADRVLAVDESGGVVDGDRILGLIALRLHEEGELANNTVVGTVMSNLGLRRALEERGIAFVAAPVGDKFVAETMSEQSAVLGGEQSGHVIFSRHAPTGDGILTALQLAALLRAEKEPLSKLAHFFEPFPQVLVNVPVADRQGLEAAARIWEEVRLIESDLGREGRVLLRASGTEPMVRVMVEADDEASAHDAAQRLARVVEKHLGSP